MNRHILKALLIATTLINMSQAAEGVDPRQQPADDLEMFLCDYINMIVESENMALEHQQYLDALLVSEEQYYQEKMNQGGLCGYMGEMSKTTGAELLLGDNLFLAPRQGILGYDFTEGDYILERENSSGKNNCCLLFSLIRNDRDLFQKIMGPSANIDYIINNPELANICDEDAQEMGMTRRSLKDVRGKFFEDIKNKLQESFYTSNGNEVKLEDFLVANIDKSPTFEEWGIKDIALALEVTHENDLCLDDYFSTIFSWLYDVPVMIFVQNGDQLENGMLPEGMPYFDKDGAKEAMLVYHSGTHYQKLRKLAVID